MWPVANGNFQSAPNCACELSLRLVDFFTLPNLSEEGVDPERRVDENVGGAQLGSRFPGRRGNRLKNERLAVPHRKNLCDSASRLASCG
jgi:hypothetical protein